MSFGAHPHILVAASRGGMSLGWADLALGIPLVVAVTAAAVTWYLARLSERRRLYAEATKAALAWLELLYRVRRRGSDDEVVVRALVDRFHDAQEQISFYEGWIGSESEGMAASYRTFVRGVKGKTEHLITEAWNRPPRPLPGNAVAGEDHPGGAVSELTDEFLRQVRNHLSVLPSLRRGNRKPTPAGDVEPS